MSNTVYLFLGYESWWSELKKYSIEKENFSNWEQIANNEVFPTAMSNFLYSSSGAKFQENFKFSGNITCGQPVPQIKVRIQEKKQQNKCKFLVLKI